MNIVDLIPAQQIFAAYNHAILIIKIDHSLTIFIPHFRSSLERIREYDPRDTRPTLFYTWW
jgi:hypothetical protein